MASFSHNIYNRITQRDLQICCSVENSATVPSSSFHPSLAFLFSLVLIIKKMTLAKEGVNQGVDKL